MRTNQSVQHVTVRMLQTATQDHVDDSYKYKGKEMATQVKVSFW